MAATKTKRKPAKKPEAEKAPDEKAPDEATDQPPNEPDNPQPDETPTDQPDETPEDQPDDESAEPGETGQQAEGLEYQPSHPTLENAGLDQHAAEEERQAAKTAQRDEHNERVGDASR